MKSWTEFAEILRNVAVRKYLDSASRIALAFMAYWVIVGIGVLIGLGFARLAESAELHWLLVSLSMILWIMLGMAGGIWAFWKLTNPLMAYHAEEENE